ncbi:MAG: ShlB/FhaC/HecB family hemolysin secretion/activation protein [Aquabacterium sp.]|uniref:ShlB/FhaC/HecB family hemolysin secretion/activation protein n=1 Tax=Aquabacterium sp. TaxID=1872578 RepID=UPI003BAF6737
MPSTLHSLSSACRALCRPQGLAGAVALSLAAACPSVMAQGAATGASAVTPQAGAAADAAHALPRELGKPEDDLVLDVSAYQIDGLPQAEREALAAVTAPYIGKERHYEDLVNAAAAITRYMQRDLGYYVGFAYLPEQSPQGGVVRLQALEGRLERVDLRWPDEPIAVKREVVERYLSVLQPGGILRVDEVERVALLVNDLQGLSARFEIEAGQAPGTAVLVVTPQAQRRVRGRVDLDTLGSRYTGLVRLSGLLTVASPLGQGDALSVNALASHSGGLTQAGITYVTPVGARGLKLGAGLSQIHYQIDKDDFPTDLDGRATAASLYALYPFVRSRNVNLFGLGSFEHKRFTDDQGGVSYSRKHSDDWQIGVIGDARDSLGGGAINTFEAHWLHGRIRFDTGSLPDGYKSSYDKLSLGYSRLQNVVSNRLQLYARYKAQISATNLDISERFAVGGPLGVRAYAPGVASADTGHVLTAELRFLPPETWFGRFSRELVFSTFYDWGQAKFSHDPDLRPAGLDNTATLSAYGLGMVWERPGDISLRMHLAWRGTGDQLADGRERQQPRANAVLSKSF